MPSYSVDLDVLRHAVRDRSLTQVDSLLTTKITSPLSLGNVPFTPTAELAVSVLNQAADKDDDAVFGSGPATHITFDLQSAWVKYKLTAKAEAELDLPLVQAKGSGEIELADYRIHRPTDEAWKALTSDLSSPRTLLDFDDVQKLQPGEALTMELGGELTAAVTVAWADVISSQLSELTSLVPARYPIAVKLRTGLEATASITVSDQFSLIISRTPEGHFRIAVKKAKSRDHALSIEAGFSAEANGAEAVEVALEPLFESITGVALEQAESLADQPTVAKLAERLGIADDASREEKVKEGVASLKETLREKLEKMMRWKAKAGFAYEYGRIDENTAIADFILLDPALLRQDYDLAIRGNFRAITAELRQDTGSRSIVRYLNESTLTRRAAFGFSLGISKWLQVKTREETVFTQTTRTSVDGFRLITSRGTRRYEEKNVPQNDFEWIVDLKAQMTDFLERPSSRDFDYGLHYAVMLERNSIAENDLERMLDFAAMWGVSTPPADTFDDALGRKGTLRLQLLFDRDELQATLAASTGDLGEWADPLAAAMPYMSTFPERSTFAARAAVYTGAWQQWLAGASLSNAQWAGRLRPGIDSGLILLEERGLPASFVWTATQGHPQLRDRLTAFTRGIAKLHEAMTTAQTPESIGKAYGLLQQFWTQRLYIAASGRYLLAKAREAGVTPTVSLQAEFDDVTITC